MFETEKFKNAMEDVRKRFFLVEDFAELDRNSLPKGVLERAMEVDGDELERFSYSLSGKELESLLFDVLSQKSLAFQERAAQILNTRFSPRLIKLFFVLYQAHYDVDAMRLLRRRMIREAKRRGYFPQEGLFFWDFDDTDSFFEDIKENFKSNFNRLDDYFEKYQIRGNSRLAMEIRLYCLEDADIDLIHLNLSHFMSILEKKQERAILTAVTNYIYLSDIDRPVNEVFLLILERLGDPALSDKWKLYERRTIEKFSQWSFYHRLKLHSERYPKKYEVLSQYYEQVEESYELEGSALVMDFGSIVVVDIPDNPYSFFFYKWEFKRQIKEWEEMGVLPVFYKKLSDQISARDYIIEDMDAPYIILQYEGVGLLYIKEILEIQLNLIPDFRNIRKRKNL
ncbi:MAG: hypothetical protein ACOX4U_03885 [Anaerovoracaceae bacterium]|jgi:hypothetical protein